MATQYQNDDYEHNFGRWRVVNSGQVVTRYFARCHADEHVDRLRKKCYGRGAHVEDGGRELIIPARK